MQSSLMSTRREGLVSVCGFLAVQPGGSLPLATPCTRETRRQWESVGGPRDQTTWTSATLTRGVSV